jgi:hypothetical protein
MCLHHVAADPAGLVGDHPLVGELHQVAGDEARGDPARAQGGDEQHGGVAAAAAPPRQGLLRRPDAGLLADDVAKGAVHGAVHRHQGLDRPAARGQLRQELAQPRAAGQRLVRRVEERGEVPAGLVRVGEGQLFAALVEEEVEGVHRPDAHGQLHADLQPLQPRAPLEGELGHVVAEGVLLPAQHGLPGHVQAVALDGGPGVRGGPQADAVRPQRGRGGVVVDAAVQDVEAHGGLGLGYCKRAAFGHT